MISDFNISKDIVSSFRLDDGIIYMTVGTTFSHIEIALPKSCTEELIELNNALEERKVNLQAEVGAIQLRMYAHQMQKAINSTF